MCEGQCVVAARTNLVPTSCISWGVGCRRSSDILDTKMCVCAGQWKHSPSSTIIMHARGWCRRSSNIPDTKMCVRGSGSTYQAVPSSCTCGEGADFVVIIQTPGSVSDAAAALQLVMSPPPFDRPVSVLHQRMCRLAPALPVLAHLHPMLCALQLLMSLVRLLHWCRPHRQASAPTATGWLSTLCR